MKILAPDEGFVAFVAALRDGLISRGAALAAGRGHLPASERWWLPDVESDEQDLWEELSRSGETLVPVLFRRALSMIVVADHGATAAAAARRPVIRDMAEVLARYSEPSLRNVLARELGLDGHGNVEMHEH